MWFNKQDKFPYKEGLMQAVGVVVYVAMFTLLITGTGRLVPHINQAFAPLMFLTLFCFSVLACGLMVFYRPYMLFMDKRGKEAVQLVLSTTKWLGVFAVGTIVLVALMSR
ncbi:MAG: hypothetical protein ABII21_00045 [bacterium]